MSSLIAANLDSSSAICFLAAAYSSAETVPELAFTGGIVSTGGIASTGVLAGAAEKSSKNGGATGKASVVAPELPFTGGIVSTGGVESTGGIVSTAGGIVSTTGGVTVIDSAVVPVTESKVEVAEVAASFTTSSGITYPGTFSLRTLNIGLKKIGV